MAVPQQFTAFTYPTVPATYMMMGGQSSASSAESQKRGRGEEGAEHHCQPQHQSQQVYTQPAQPPAPQAAYETPLPEQSSKKSRNNTYVAPRTVKPSILTAMGSLAGGSTANNGSGSSGPTPGAGTFVPLRRRLSGGALDQYIGGHYTMDMDTNDCSRPRSMSF